MIKKRSIRTILQHCSFLLVPFSIIFLKLERYSVFNLHEASLTTDITYYRFTSVCKYSVILRNWLLSI